MDENVGPRPGSRKWRCPCGVDHTDDSVAAGILDALVERLGPTMVVGLTDGRAWRVPRVYLGFHGMQAERLPDLAARYGWEPAATPVGQVLHVPAGEVPAGVGKGDHPPAYVCPKCQRQSWHPEDARHRYCGVCGFEDGGGH